MGQSFCDALRWRSCQCHDCGLWQVRTRFHLLRFLVEVVCYVKLCSATRAGWNCIIDVYHAMGGKDVYFQALECNSILMCFTVVEDGNIHLCTVAKRFAARYNTQQMQLFRSTPSLTTVLMETVSWQRCTVIMACVIIILPPLAFLQRLISDSGKNAFVVVLISPPQLQQSTFSNIHYARRNVSCPSSSPHQSFIRLWVCFISRKEVYAHSLSVVTIRTFWLWCNTCPNISIPILKR